MTEILQTRLGMQLLETFTKPTKVFKKGVLETQIFHMVRIKCACGETFTTHLTKWRNCQVDSCKPCVLKKNKRGGFGVHSVKVRAK